MSWLFICVLAACVGGVDDEGFLEAFPPGRSALERRLEPLIGELNLGDAFRRRGAVDSVIDWGTFGDLRRSLLNHFDQAGSRPVRRNLLLIIAGLQDPQSLDALLKLIASGRFRDPELLTVSALAFGKVGELKPAWREWVERALQDDAYPGVATAAAMAMGMSGDAASLDALVKVDSLKKRDDWMARRKAAALYARARLNDSSALSLAAELLGRPGDEATEIRRLGAWLALAQGVGRGALSAGMRESLVTKGRTRAAKWEQAFSAAGLVAYAEDRVARTYVGKLFGVADPDVLLTVIPVLEKMEQDPAVWRDGLDTLQNLPPIRRPQYLGTAIRVLGADASPWLREIAEAKRLADEDLQAVAILGLALHRMPESKAFALSLIRSPRSPRLMRAAWLYLAALSDDLDQAALQAIPLPSRTVPEWRLAHHLARKALEGRIERERLDAEIHEALEQYAPTFEQQRDRLANQLGLWCLFGVRDPRLIKPSVIGQEASPTAGLGGDDGDSTGSGGSSGYNSSGNSPKSSRLQPKTTFQEDLEAWFLVSPRPYYGRRR